MHALFSMVRFYPYWALPVAIIAAETGFYFRRREKPVRFYFFAFSALLVLGLAGWFFFRGDVNSDAWVRALTFSS
jgi:energy-coupling factor transporter transmembrane protein EcfT